MAKAGQFKIVLLVLFAVGIALNVVFGNTGGHAHGFNINEHGFYILDFVVFILLIGYFVKKPAKAFLENRHETVRTEMDNAGKVLEEAQARLSQYEGQLKELGTEAKQLDEDFRAAGERDKSQLESETEATVAKIKRDLETRLYQETARIRDELQKKVCTDALELAEEKIRSSMDKSTQRRLVKQYIGDLQQIEKLGEYRRSTA
jgi:F-type H+-transporting ATPase subunit b